MNRVGSLTKVQQLFKNGKLSPVELCDMCFGNIKSSSNINAFITLTEDAARQDAEKSWNRYRQGKPIGSLDGVPVAIKDNFCMEGIRTTCASKMLENYFPPYTATVVRKLQAQGAVVVGKTNMDEFAMGTGSVDSIYGPVKNPYTSGILEVKDTVNDFNICGGSSGGSAAAVAANCCVMSLGSDTGGSTRNPAARCGIVGLKPTYGLLSRHGLIPLVNSMDVPGLMANSVDGVVALLNTLAGHDPLDSTTVHENFDPFSLPNDIKINNLSIGIPDDVYSSELANEVMEALERVKELLTVGGAKIVSASLPHTQYSLPCYSVLNSCEVASNFAKYDGIEYGHRENTNESTEALYASSRKNGFNEVVRGRILAGNYFLLQKNYEEYFVKAMKIRRLITDDYNRVFSNGIDLLLTPVTFNEAPLYSTFTQKDNREQVALQDYFTQPMNMAGIPAVSFPVLLSQNGLPIGLQLVSQCFQEFKLLSVAKWLEQCLSFNTERLVVL